MTAAGVLLVLLVAFAAAVAAQCTVCRAGEVGVLRPDFVAGPANGCGAGATEDLVPDLRFGSCWCATIFFFLQRLCSLLHLTRHAQYRP